MADADHREKSVKSDALVCESPTQMTSVALPLPVYRRLQELMEAAKPAKPTRADLLSQLIATADPAGLAKRVMDYRELTVAELFDVEEGDDVVVPIRRPGRPSKAS